MEIDRADMKLLIEAGYSGVMRGIDTDLAPIFDGIAEWMPEYAAGPIGQALLAMTGGDLAGADEILTRVVASDLTGRDEAVAVLAMCKALQNEPAAAAELAGELKGTGGDAETFADLLVGGDGQRVAAGAAPVHETRGFAGDDDDHSNKIHGDSR